MPGLRVTERASCCLAMLFALSCVACSGSSEEGGAAGSGSRPLGSVGGGGQAGALGASGDGGGDGAGTSPSDAGSPAGGAAAMPPGTEQTEACIDHVREWCRSRVACHIWSDVEECLANGSVSCPDLYFSEGSAQSPDTLGACGREWGGLSCDALATTTAPACLVPGTRKAGESCLFRTQCESLLCSGSADTCGACIEVLRPGDACGDGTPRCPAGHSCLQGRCEATVAGPPATLVGVDELCSSGSACDGGLFCGDGADGMKRCLPTLPIGGACEGSEMCDQSAGLYCDETMTCAVPPGADQPCAVAETWLCERDSYCDDTVTPYLCRPRAGVDEPCTPLTGCRDGMTCECETADCEARQCKRRRKLGEGCAAQGDLCVPGSQRCEQGVCTAVTSQHLFETLCAP